MKFIMKFDVAHHAIRKSNLLKSFRCKSFTDARQRFSQRLKIAKMLKVDDNAWSKMSTARLASTWAISFGHLASALLLAVVFLSLMSLVLSAWFRDFGKGSR